MSAGISPIDPNTVQLPERPKEKVTVGPLITGPYGQKGRMVSKKVFLPPLGAEAFVISFEPESDFPKKGK